MRDIFRRGHVQRYSLALIFIISITVLLGQEPPVQKSADQAAGKEAAQATATPPPPPPASDATATPPAAEPAKTPEAAPAPVPAVQPNPAAGQPKGKAPAKKGKGVKADQTGVAPTFTGVDSQPYVIGPEDVLFLNVLHQQDVTGQIIVRPDGFVTVRYAGEIKAAGLTTQQLTDIVTEKLTAYFNHPEVNIQVALVKSKKYYLSGEVKRPGSYTLATPKTVLEALIEGGGLADFAKSKKIYVLRGQQKIMFNYNDVSKGKHLEQNILLLNGDVVIVP